MQNLPKNKADKFKEEDYSHRTTEDLESYHRNLANYLSVRLYTLPEEQYNFQCRKAYWLKMEERVKGLKDMIAKRNRGELLEPTPQQTNVIKPMVSHGGTSTTQACAPAHLVKEYELLGCSVTKSSTETGTAALTLPPPDEPKETTTDAPSKGLYGIYEEVREELAKERKRKREEETPLQEYCRKNHALLWTPPRRSQRLKEKEEGVEGDSPSY